MNKKRGKQKKERSLRELEISRRISGIIEEKGFTPHYVAKKVGIDPGNFYRMLKGERGWSIDHLERIAGFLQRPFEEISGGTIRIPLVSKITALEPFSYIHEITPEAALSFVDYKGTGKGKMLEDLYAVEVKDRSMMPAFAPGTKFIVEKDTSELIKDGGLVVCPNENGLAQLCRVHFTTPQHIVLRSLNPTIPDKTLPRSHLKLCDRVTVILPA